MQYFGFSSRCFVTLTYFNIFPQISVAHLNQETFEKITESPATKEEDIKVSLFINKKRSSMTTIVNILGLL